MINIESQLLLRFSPKCLKGVSQGFMTGQTWIDKEEELRLTNAQMCSHAELNVWMKVSHFKDWIQSTIAENLEEEKESE